MSQPVRVLPFVLAVAVAVISGTTAECRRPPKVSLEIAKIYWEYNSSANDLGVQVSLDAEDWKRLKIVNPKNRTIFDVEGRGPYQKLGLTELFFEGAEPSLAEFPLQDLLALFPEGAYEFIGRTVDNGEMESTAQFSHAIPAGPTVSAAVGPGNSLVISWSTVTTSAPGLPAKPVNIVGYQVIVDPFQVTVPAGTNHVTVPPEFVASLASGQQPYEVLAIDASGNQTITEGVFVKP